MAPPSGFGADPAVAGREGTAAGAKAPSSEVAGRAVRALSIVGDTAPALAGNHLRTVLIATDGVAGATAWLFALHATGTVPPGLRAPCGIVGAVVAAGWLVASASALYRSRVCSVRSLELAHLLRVSALSSVLGVVIVAANDEDPASTLVELGAVAIVVQFLLLATGRSIFDDWLKQRRARGEYCRKLLLFGFDDDLDRLVEVLDDQPELGFRVLGYVGPATGPRPRTRTRRLGSYADALGLVERCGASGVVVAGSLMSDPAAGPALDAVLRADVHVHVSAGLQGIAASRVRPLPIGHEPLLYIERPDRSPWRDVAKRASDLALAPVLLVLASPVLAVAAAAVKLFDGGPVIYRQERVGRDGSPFEVLKLRTMVLDADRRRGELASANERTGPLFKVTDDPRVTPPGRVLRLLSIDELPQLWNVVRGEMSLVGPRPALAAEVEAFDDVLRRRHEVRPGITGLWQIEARDNPSFAAYRRLDVFYVDNRSLALDLVILVLTAHAVVLRAIHALGRRRSPSAAPLARSIAA